jgi:hypothetical protein
MSEVSKIQSLAERAEFAEKVSFWERRPAAKSSKDSLDNLDRIDTNDTAAPFLEIVRTFLQGKSHAGLYHF